MSWRPGDSFVRQTRCDACGSTLSLTEQMHNVYYCDDCLAIEEAEAPQRDAFELVGIGLNHAVEAVSAVLVIGIVLIAAALIQHVHPPCATGSAAALFTDCARQ